MKQIWKITCSLLLALLLCNTFGSAALAAPRAFGGWSDSNTIDINEHTLSLALAPGASGVHEFAIYNRSSSSDVYTVAVSSTYGWFDSREVAATYSVAAHSSVELRLPVYAPPLAPVGSYDTITVRVTGQDGTATAVSTTFFTHVLTSPVDTSAPIQFEFAKQFANETDGVINVSVVRPTTAITTFASVEYTPLDGTAISFCDARSCTTDYISSSGRLIFYPGEARKSFAIQLKQDTLIEDSEYFDIRLAAPLNTTLGATASTRATILHDAVIPSTTKVMDSATSAALSGMDSAGTLTFSSQTPYLQAVRKDDVIVAGVAANTPSGMLRKVTGKQLLPNGQVVLTTEPATLEQAIQQGGAALRKRLTPQDVADVTLAPGVTLGRSSAQPNLLDKFTLDINKVLYDADGNPATKNDQIVLSGRTVIDPVFDFMVDLGWFSLDELNFEVGVKQSTDIKLSANVQIQRTETITLAEYAFTPMTVMVGIVPLVFEPKLTVTTGIEGKFKLALSIGVKQELDAIAGVHYDDTNGWQNLSHFTPSTSFTPPTLAATLDGKAFLDIKGTLKLYGVVGPHALVSYYLKIAANTSQTPWWTLKHGLLMQAGMAMDLISLITVDYEAVVFDQSWELAHAPIDTTERVSVSSSGAQANNSSYVPTVSADGRYSVFSSGASNLVAGDTAVCDPSGSGRHNCNDIFIHDNTTGETTRISQALGGAQPNGDSTFPSISADGRFVLFESKASNLVPNDTNASSDIFLFDRTTSQITRVSVGSNGEQVAGSSAYAHMTPDARFITFVTAANNLIPGNSSFKFNVYLYDRAAGTTTYVSHGQGGALANGHSSAASISADGEYLVFASNADNLVADDTNGMNDVFLYRRSTNTIARIASLGTTGLNLSDNCAVISADGSTIALASIAALLPADTNNQYDIYTYARQTGQLTLVSLADNGMPSTGGAAMPQISADGTQVAFVSAANNLVDGDSDNRADVFLYTQASGNLKRITKTIDGAPLTSDVVTMALSANGRYIVYQTSASNVVANDTNNAYDIFLYSAAQ